MGTKRLDLTGMRFGRLVAQTFIVNKTSTKWTCMCDCGKIVCPRSSDLRSGRTQSCGCLRRDRRIGVPGANRLRPYEAIFNRIGKAHKYPVSITYDDFLSIISSGSCHYCGTDVTIEEYTGLKSKGAYRLDRMDNAIGYTRDNCVLCCYKCNSGKSNRFSCEQWKYIVKCMKQRKDLFP
jgi:hypothetical protein